MSQLSNIYLANVILDFGCVMVNVLVSSGVDLWSGQTKNYEIGICCYSARMQHLGERADWFARNQNGVATCLSTDCCFSELAL